MADRARPLNPTIFVEFSELEGEAMDENEVKAIIDRAYTGHAALVGTFLALKSDCGQDLAGDIWHRVPFWGSSDATNLIENSRRTALHNLYEDMVAGLERGEWTRDDLIKLVLHAADPALANRLSR
jgi:hypothetical protein